MGKKVFCGGLPWETDEIELSSVMAQFGEVQEAKVVTDRETGRSRGFGFVTFAHDEGAEEAVRVGSITISGRKVQLEEAKDKPKGGRRR